MRSEPFDLFGELPSGVAVLEASAGTGKTFALAALAARYVADGLPLEQLLMVTFTRMATGELRERVRDRLVRAERVLDDALLGRPLPAEDEVGRFLADGTREEVRIRRDRLARAVADFDAATITTTHGFCLEALGSLGFAGDVAADCRFVEDVSELTREVVDDLFVRRFRKQAPIIGREQAGVIARAAINHPSARLVPEDAPADATATLRVRLAQAVRDELERRKRAAGVMTFDDLLTRLDDTLRGDDGEEVAARLRARYRVVLVDEFQDTDPTQWSIMSRAFDHPDGTLVLIGDPKQAIYAFRGADVYAYLAAAEAARTQRTLTLNWRSDQGLLDAYDQLFGEAELGAAGIRYRKVRATEDHQVSRLVGAPRPEPLRIRVLDRSAPHVVSTRGGSVQVGSARDLIAQDVADETVALLVSGARIAADAGERLVRPGDLAVLVRRNRDATEIRDRLHAAGVPAVVGGAGSVFGGPPARAWLALLEALERPTSAPRARAVALTVFLGWSATRIAEADEAAWESVHRRLHAWAQVLRERGVAALQEVVTRAEALPRRVLTFVDGERELTDLRHVGQLLHRAAREEHLGASALTAWLRRRIAEAGQETDEERSRRLESDAAAVQVLTIHRAKGLEFPIVFCPSLWDPTWISDKPEPVFFHDPEQEDARTLDVGLDGPQYGPNRARHRAELRGEELRLAYVALTRAQHQAVIWWAGSHASGGSPLSRLAFARQPDGTVPLGTDGALEDEEAVKRFEALAAGAPGCIGVELAKPSRLPAIWSEPIGPSPSLAVARFDRPLDEAWRRTSYSDITAAAHDAPVASEPEQTEQDDEATVTVTDEAGEDPLGLRELPSPMADLPGGTGFGTLVHDLLEAVDFATEDLPGELAARLAEGRHRLPTPEAKLLTVTLAETLRTPLGPVADELRLADLTRADRLDELTFELPLVGGERPTGVLTPAALAVTLREHLPADDPLAAYADRLGDPSLRAALRGFLTGSIDLAFRVRGEDGRARYGIVDYKTNRLAPFGEPLSAWEYRPEALRAAMFSSHYALQGLLYTVALHRYLRWRLPDHDPERDLMGVFYLFLRGMSGAETPRVEGTPCGVFAWRPPGALVVALSDRLDEGGVVV